MKLLVCSSFVVFFGLFAGFGTISGFSIDDYFEQLDQLDDYYYDYSAESPKDEITLHMWKLELPKEVDDSDSERTKVQSSVQPNNCFAEAVKYFFDSFGFNRYFDFLNYNKKKIHPQPNNTASEDTTTKTASSTVTPGPHEAAKNIPSTVAPEIVTTTAESKGTTTKTASSTVTPGPDEAAKNISSTVAPEIVTTTAESKGTTTKTASSTVTPGPDEAAKNISSTVAPEIVTTTAESKGTTTKTASSTMTPGPDEAAKNVSSKETPKMVTTIGGSVNNLTTAVTVDKNLTTTQEKKP